VEGFTLYLFTDAMAAAALHRVFTLAAFCDGQAGGARHQAKGFALSPSSAPATSVVRALLRPRHTLGPDVAVGPAGARQHQMRTAV
jgi:hypothetical protein